MICFQNVSLIYWRTTNKCIEACIGLLWFAFKMYLWFIDEQQHLNRMAIKLSCDLLSKCIFDLLTNNRLEILKSRKAVVICFQNVSLIYWRTTKSSNGCSEHKLWFAFKMYLWFIDEQPKELRSQDPCGCDLLSKCIFDLLTNNF